MRELMDSMRSAALLLLGMTLLTGAAYPAVVSGLGQVLFKTQAAGSLIERQGAVVGSELIGQLFDRPGWFWGRPSATNPAPYNAAASGGSNLGPSNPALLEAAARRMAVLTAAHPTAQGPAPMDLVLASASGLDPHISPQAAFYQVERVARARGLDPARLRGLVEKHIEGPQLALLGQPRVNVLLLNLALADGRAGGEGR